MSVVDRSNVLEVDNYFVGDEMVDPVSTNNYAVKADLYLKLPMMRNSPPIQFQ